MKKLLHVFILLGFLAPSAWGASQIKQDNRMQSRILGREVNYSIYLPDGYDSDSRSYPVLYLLHGSGDDHTGWSQQGEVKYIADKEIAEGRASAMIIVMPDAGQSWYLNRDDGSVNYENMFFEELIPHIESTYRTMKQKEFRAIAGLSMGGYGSLLYAMHRPDLFSSCFGMSSAVWTEEEMIERTRNNPDWVEQLYGRRMPNDHWRRNSIIDLATNMPDEQKGKVRIWIDCGDEDFLFKGNAMLHITMREKNIPHEYRVRDGGHTWTYWRTCLPDALAFASVSFRRS